MGRSIIFIILLLCASPSWGRMNVAMMGTSGAVVAGATTVLGSATQYGTAYAMIGTLGYCYQQTAAASRPLKDAFFYTSDAAGESSLKVCVYLESGANTTPDVADTGVNGGSATCASLSESGGAGWKSGAFSAGSVTSGSVYWVCSFVSSSPSGEASQWNTFRDASIESYYNTADNYGSPPNNVSGVNTSAGAHGPLSLYIRAE